MRLPGLRGRGGRRPRARLLLATLLVAAGPAAARDRSGSPPGASDLVEVVDISGLSASPDGRHVAFRTEQASLDRNSYILTWHVADSEGGRRREAGGGLPIYVDPGLLQPERSFWPPAGDAIFYRALVGEAIGLWRMPLDGSGARAILVGDADVETVQLAPDGAGLDLELGPSRSAIRRAEEAEYESGILVDSSVDLAQNLFRGGSINGRMASQRLSGDWFRRSGLLGSEPRNRYRIGFDAPGASPSPAQGPAGDAPDGVPPDAARAADGALAIIAAGAAGGVEVRLPGAAAPIHCPARLCAEGRVEALAWRPGRHQLLVTIGDRHRRQTIHIWDLDRGNVQRLAGGDGLLGGGRAARMPCAVTARFAICVASGPASPPRLDRIALDGGRRETIFDPNSGLRARAWPRVEHLAWSAAGQGHAGILLLPDAPRRRLPLLINYYRCEGFLRGGVGDEIPFIPLAQAGFAVLCIDAPPLQGPHDARATYRAALAGIRGAVAMLDGRGLIDRARIGMAGLSFGSEVTMWTAMNSDLLAAASIASVQFEPAYYWFNAMRGRDHPDIIRRSWGLGPPDEDAAGWREVSPALNVARIRAPLLMQLPEQEARYVVELHARLSNSTTPVELYVFPDEAHIKVQPRHKLAVYARNLDWFRFWLQDHVDPDPARRDQYRRWRALRDRQRSDGRPPPPAGQPQLDRR